MQTFNDWWARQHKDPTQPIGPRAAWDAALATANERIRELEAERDAQRQLHDESQQFHLACIKQLYEMIGVDGSDGEYRFKWAALELRSKLDQLTAEREVSDKLVAALNDMHRQFGASHQTVAQKKAAAEARVALAEVAAIRAKQGGEG